MEYVTYGELSREDQIALFTAWLDGGVIQFTDSLYGKWKTVTTPDWNGDSMFRIKPGKFIFNWDSIDPRWINLSRESDKWHMCTGPVEFSSGDWDLLDGSDEWLELTNKTANELFNLNKLDHLEDSETLIQRNP